MNARVGDFIQRTKWAIGFPFKFRRQQTRLLTSSSGHPEPHSSDERIVTSPVPPPPPESSAGNSVSILEDKRPAGVESSAEKSSESLQSLEDTRENLQDGVGFKDGPSRIIVNNDGSAAFYSLLLNEDLVSKQRETLMYRRQRSYLNRKIKAMGIDIMFIEGELYHAKKSNEETSSDSRASALKSLEQKLLSVCQKRDVFKNDLDILELNLEFVRDETEGIVEKALRGANMLNLPELDDDGITSIQDLTEHDQSSAAMSVQSSSTGMSMEHTFRLAVIEDMKEKSSTFHIMQDAFDEGTNDLRREQDRYEQAVRDGTCNLTQTDFDCMGLETLQQRTRDYIEAEIEYEEAKTLARALGLLDNEYEQESNFVDHPDDGYRESQEAAMTATVNPEGIEEWKAQIIRSQDIEHLDEELDADDWEAEPIGISDSISLVDFSRNGDRINRWREFCDLVREEDVGRTTPECI